MTEETLEEVCDKVLNYLYPNCKIEMNALQYGNSINALKSISRWKSERMYSDMEEYSAFVLKSYKERLPLLLAKDWFKQFKKK